MPKNPHADFTPTLAGYSGITPFRFWCQTALPLTYDDSLSYYELLNKVVNYLNHTIEDLTNVENNTSELAEAYEKLQEYVNDYFDDIDIEAELRNVLDGMAEDGTLDALLNPLVENQLPGVVDEKIDGVVAEQIDSAVAGQIDESVADQLPALVDAGIPEEVSGWLTENVDPVGSAVMVDSSLTISGAAADAKVTGDEVSDLKTQLKLGNAGEMTIAGSLSYGVFENNFPVADSRKFNAVMMQSEQYDRDITITAKTGYNFLAYWYDQNDAYVGRTANWSTSRTIPANTPFRLWIRENPLDTSAVLDLNTVKYDIVFNTEQEDEIDKNTDDIALNTTNVALNAKGLQKIDATFVWGSMNTTTGAVINDPAYRYQVVMPTAVHYDRDVTIKCNPGYRFQVWWYSAADEYISRTGSFRTSSDEYVVTAGTYFRLFVTLDPPNNQVTVDPSVFANNIFVATELAEKVKLNAELDGKGLEQIKTSFEWGTMDTTTGAVDVSDSYKYQAIMPNTAHYDRDITLKCNSGYQFQVYWYDSAGNYISRTANFKNSDEEYVVTQDKYFRIFIRLDPSDIQAVVYPSTFYNNIYMVTEIGERVSNLEEQPFSALPEYIVNTMSYKPVGTLSKGYILLTCDDGTEGLATYTIPMLINKNVPATFGLLKTSAVITNDTYLATVIDAIENHGCCVAQHGSEQWPTYTEKALNEYFDETETLLTSKGITEIHGAICPGGAGIDTNTLVKAIAGGRFGSVFSGGLQDELKYGNYNEVGARTNQYAMARYSAIGFTQAAYQAAIDEAYENHYILCPFWHDYSVVDDAEKQAIIEGMIDYAKTKGLTFITMKDLPSIT